MLGAVLKLSEEIGAAAGRALANLTQPPLPVAPPKRGRPLGSRTRKPRQTVLAVSQPEAAPQKSDGAL